MSSALKFVLKWVALLLLFVAYMYWFLDLVDHENAPAQPTLPAEPTLRDLPLERSDDQLFSPQSEALIQAFTSHQLDLEVLRDTMDAEQVLEVWLFAGELKVQTADGGISKNEDVPGHDNWLEMMERAAVVGVLKNEHIDMIVFFVEPPRTTPERNENINYYFKHPIPAKECSDQFRHIRCGVCDVKMEDNWSIRFEWSSGEFEREYSEAFSNTYGSNASESVRDEIESKLRKARKECRQTGLQEMGYDDPDLY